MHRLRELIAGRNLTQKQFAAELGYTHTAVNNWVCGVRSPDLETVSRLCDYFGCTADYFLGRSSVPYATVSEDDARLIMAYHSAREKDQRTVDQVLSEYLIAAEEKKVV